MKYEYLEHTADAKFRAYGNDLNEKFSNSALAFFNIITDTNKVRPATKKEFTVKAKRLRSLLYEFLEEFIVIIDTEGFLLSKIAKVVVDEKNLTANIIMYGDIGDYEILTQIKSITYNDMELTDKYFQVVVDI